MENIKIELMKLKNLLISNKAFKEKIFNRISMEDKVKYNFLNEIFKSIMVI